jgi:Holliday junction resolvase RusA-like endonuclease
MKLSKEEFDKYFGRDKRLNKNGSSEETRVMAEVQSTDAPRPDQHPEPGTPALDILLWPYPVSVQDITARVTFVGAPVAKSRARFGRGNVYTPKETTTYERSVKALFLDCLGGAAPDPDSRFALRCLFFRPNRVRIDCDNLMKAVSDAATGVVWKDDRQVLEIVGRLYLGCAEGKAEILIHRVPDTTRKDFCQRCGKEYTTYPSLKARFCSNECRNTVKRVELQCSGCQVRFTIPVCVARKRGGKDGRVFCSKSCAAKHMKRRRLPPKGRKVFACPQCGGPMSKPHYISCQPCHVANRYKHEPTSNYWSMRRPIHPQVPE